MALAVAALAVACLPGCGSPREAAEPEGRGEDFYAAALKSVEATEDPLRQELLRTCDKWRHLDRPCDEEAVRRDLLDCWVDKGQRILVWVEGRQLRPRARASRTLLEVNTCMELKRWRKLQSGPELNSTR